MCEPAHSIVQYPAHDNDDDSPFGGQMDMGQKLKASLGEQVVQWGRRIKNWFHFSKLGSGHTDSIELSGKSSLILPEHTRYEGLWWDRRLIIDGPYRGASVDRQAALESADQYYHSVTIGNMKLFRRFLETSINRSTRSWYYVDRFISQVLTKGGRDAVIDDFRRNFNGGKSLQPMQILSVFGKEETKGPATKVLMKYTRRRGLFVPEWADDPKIW